MNYHISLAADAHTKIKQIWSLAADSNILDITAFADFFVQYANGNIEFYNITEGEKIDVSDLVAEHGLPPVSIELGGEWYQLDAFSAVVEDGWTWSEQQCLGFKQPLFEAGEYTAENMAVMDIIDYHTTLAAKLNFA